MSEEQNAQPENDNKNEELSEEELNDVAGGSYSWGVTNTSFSWGATNTGGLKPPSISPNLIDGIKGE